jgi:DNA-binding transcriptional ArsR family regulator
MAARALLLVTLLVAAAAAPAVAAGGRPGAVGATGERIDAPGVVRPGPHASASHPDEADPEGRVGPPGGGNGGGGGSSLHAVPADPSRDVEVTSGRVASRATTEAARGPHLRSVDVRRTVAVVATAMRYTGAVTVGPEPPADAALALASRVAGTVDGRPWASLASGWPDSLPGAPDGGGRVLLALGGAGYGRNDGDDGPLAHGTRARLFEAIESRPGRHLTALGEATDTPRSTVRYHVRVLEREGVVTVDRGDGRTRLFPAATDDGDRRLAAALRREGAAAVLRSLAADGPDTVTGLAERLDRAPSTVSHHLGRLAEDGLVARERDGATTRVSLSGPARGLADGAAGTDTADATAGGGVGAGSGAETESAGGTGVDADD